MKKILTATALGLVIVGSSVIGESSNYLSSNEDFATVSDTTPRRDTARKKKKPNPDTTRPDSVRQVPQK